MTQRQSTMGRAGLLAVALMIVPLATAAQESGAAETPSAEPSWKPKLTFGLEAKVHGRHSEENVFPIRFPLPLPPGAPAPRLETVDAGTHLEFSSLTLFADAAWNEAVTAHATVDLVSLHDRNPTSTGRRLDVHEAWLRLGRETAPAVTAEKSGVYLKAGKFPHFERQNDRHLESWGMLSTAFNRFEDVGVELGADLGRHLYLKASYTAGNPVFIRDPNALAGDHGTPTLLQPPPNNVPELQSGFVILYDAETPDLGGRNPQTSAGLGLRCSDASGDHAADFLVWARERRLAERVGFEGTFYGGDLDVLNGPNNTGPLTGPYSLPIRDDKKREAGANLWLYLGSFSFFGQYVDQKIAGLKRTGYEGEAAYKFELPLRWAIGGQQLFPHVQPALRYSEIKPEFTGGSPQFPAPSVRWQWKKLDYGVRLGIVHGVHLTVEYSDNRFFVPTLKKELSNNEFLATLSWKT